MEDVLEVKLFVQQLPESESEMETKRCRERKVKEGTVVQRKYERGKSILESC